MSEMNYPESISALPIPKELTMPAITWVAEQIPGGFFIYSGDERQEILYVNQFTLQIFGCKTIEEFRKLTGNTFRGLVHPDDLEAVEKSITAQIDRDKSEKMDYVEYRIIRADGEVRWVDDYGHFATLPGYGDVYYVFIGDITEKRRAQMEKFRMEMELERQKHANEIKSAFLFNMSHDIRTPMNAVMGFSELAKRHIDEREKLESYLNKVNDSSRQLLLLIDDLLEMSRLDYGRIELKAEPCDLAEELNKVLELFQAQMEEKHLKLTLHSELPEGKVIVDANRFRRIMGNLLSNAVKFTPAGGSVTVTAVRRQVSESGFARYEFAVSDTGIGMSEEFMRRMYEAFEREQSSTKTGEIGTGLGLAITKNLLDVMGGSISVKSRKGEGTTFTVELPLKLAEHAGAAAQDGTAAEDVRADGEHRILLVEDIEINRMLAETILQEAGFLVESVPDGCDAVEAIAQKPDWYYDLVLMDIQMPVMNGYEATRAIRKLDRADADRLPIIALSANAREEDRRESLESGMNSHIAKPFDIAQLIQTVNEYIAARGK